MQSKLLRTGLFTAVLALAPTYLAAQEATPAPASEAPAEQTEAQRIQAQINAIQERAMQNSEVQAAFAEVNATLERVDPEYRELTARGVSIREEITAAQAAQDNERLHALAEEVPQLNQRLQAARARAAAHPDAVEKTNEFRTKLFEAMVAIDPETQNLVARLGELNGQ
jgi:predicted  nucleic acid-binding Zn-ribbon protein